MRRAWGLTILLALAPQAWAQAPLDAGERQGRALHPALRRLPSEAGSDGGAFGPALSKDSLNGNAEVMRIFIREGSPRMPGFKYEFTPAEVNTIIRYLQSVPAQAQPAPTPASARAGQAD